LLIFLTALSGFVSQAVGVDDAMGSINDWLFNRSGLPRSAAEAIQTPLQDVITSQSGGFLSIGALLALWSGKNAIAAFMKALNVAFDVKETRPWWKKTAIAVGLTVALGLALVAASSFFLAGSFVGEGLADRLGLGNVWTTVWSYLRWVLIPLVAAVAVACFYWAGPNVDTSFKWLTPGSVVTVVLWGVATLGMGIYFQYGAGYLETYGVLGAVLAFVFWLYVMSFILLFGGELNSVLARAHDPAIQAEVADPAKQTDGADAKRRAAAGKDGQTTPQPAAPPAPAPVTATVPFAAAYAALPSAEREARIALAAEGSAGRERRFRSALTALGASIVAALSAALVGSGRR
jgi:membrane protein